MLVQSKVDTLIKALSEDLRNKIAAGEVVENPASVVKELIENSIDANANEISVIVEKGGHQLIQVRDNGDGIMRDDLPLSILRFNTSKINKLNDLFNIETLGFRGEALSSIASVCDLQVISNNKDYDGYKLNVTGGISNDVQPHAKIGGTEVTIQNLFFNTPVRKKFLKTPRTELRKIIEVVRRYGLAFPEKVFRIISDNRTIFHVQRENLEDRINNLMDPTYSSNLLPVNLVKEDYIFSGFIGNLNLIRKRPGEQYLFVNNRFIKDKLINKAVYNAYESLIKRGEYPFFLINIKMPPDQVDVNIHPMKTEVRFIDEWRVFSVLKAGIRDSLGSILDTIPNFSNPVFKSQKMDLNDLNDKPLFKVEKSIKNQSVLQDSLDLKISDMVTPVQKKLERAKTYVSKLAEIKTNQSEPIATENIWQIHRKYILSEIRSGLVIIDQHVAHERILYEDALKAFESTSMSSQTVLFPESINFSLNDIDRLLDILPYLEKIGFKMKKESETTIRIEAIPTDMSLGSEKVIIREILDNFSSQKKQYSSFQEDLAAMFSCKAAIKAGDSLSKQEMQELVNRLFLTKHPYYCPHGRPIIIKMSIDELDSRFERPKG